ncbi:hypothetical protein I3271_03290 [Photobacterium leiognathi]|uniref:hypothetical protein n=1 Tax=Photobacterium leiognathi TaxID=553611 RepID=UPI001EDDC1A7|nr:hypothetical protein [Photobacterium leiognathi]MCG3883705.1 hypothetical protein [Photobacterium leiognathi]
MNSNSNYYSVEIKGNTDQSLADILDAIRRSKKINILRCVLCEESAYMWLEALKTPRKQEDINYFKYHLNGIIDKLGFTNVTKRSIQVYKSKGQRPDWLLKSYNDLNNNNEEMIF